MTSGGDGIFAPWKQFEKPTRTRQALSREAIVDAAMMVIDEEGLSALSMRTVAHVLRTGPASLYAHVASKEQLIELVMDRVYGEFDIPEPDPARWQEQLRQFVKSAQRILLSHPGVAAATLGGPPMGPNGLRLMEGTIALARAAGLPDRVSAYVGELIGQYIAVTALEQETIRDRFGNVSQERIAELVAQFRDYLQSLPADKYPTLAALARSGDLMSPDTDDERFELGLDILIRGLASYAAGD